MGDRIKRALETIKSNRIVARALQVNARYGEDGGGYLSAALAYYGFLSLFPLILVGLSAIGFVLAHDTRAQAEWAARLAGSVPGLGSLIGNNISAVVDKRAGAGVIGVVGLLWSGTALTNAGGYALSRVYRRSGVHGFIKEKVWSVSSTLGLGLVALAGIGVAGTVAGVHARSWAGPVVAVGAVVVAYALDVALFMTCYRVLTAGWGPPFSKLWPGSLFAAAGWTTLKVAGAWYASRTVAHASEVYGTFGTVVGALTLLYLASRLFLYGAELNVVLNGKGGRTMTDDTNNDAPQHPEPAPIAGGAVAADERGAEPSTGELVTGIATDVGLLVRKEMELARHEIIEALVARLKSVGAMAAAGVLAFVGMIFGALALADLLAKATPVWASRAIVGDGFVVLAVLALMYARLRVKRPPLTPVETKRTVKEEVEWAKTQLKP